MLGKKKAYHFAETTTLIARGAVVTGDFTFSGNLEIEGCIRGNIIATEGSDSRVRVLEAGLVEGNIDVPNVVVNGRVLGEINAPGQLQLAAAAVVDGNVHYQLLEIENGAQVNGGFVRLADAGREQHPENVASFKPKTVAEECMVS